MKENAAMSSPGHLSDGIDMMPTDDTEHDNIVLYKAMAMLMVSAAMMYFLFKNFYRIMTGGTDSKTIDGLTA